MSVIDKPPYPPGLSASDRDLFDAVLIGLRHREAAFIRHYFANGKIATYAAEAAGYSCGSESGKTAGYSLTHKRPRIKAAIKAIDALLSRTAIPGLPTADVDAALAAVPGLRARQANYVRCFYEQGRDAAKAMQAAGYADPARGAGRRQLMKKQPVVAAIAAIDHLLECTML